MMKNFLITFCFNLFGQIRSALFYISFTILFPKSMTLIKLNYITSNVQHITNLPSLLLTQCFLEKPYQKDHRHIHSSTLSKHAKQPTKKKKKTRKETIPFIDTFSLHVARTQ